MSGTRRLEKWLELPSAKLQLHIAALLLLAQYLHSLALVRNVSHSHSPPFYTLAWFFTSIWESPVWQTDAIKQKKKKFCLALARQTFPSRLCIPVQREALLCCSITLSQTCMFTTFSFLSWFLRYSNKRGEHRDSYKVVSLAWDALRLNLLKQAPLWVLLKMVTHWLRSTKPCFMHWFIEQMLEQQ